MSIVIVDYGSGNLRSVAEAFERAVTEAGGAQTVTVTADPDTVRAADRVVLPGVGAFADCKRGLAAVEGLVEAIEEAVLRRGQPFLGICVGMQLLATLGFEHGEHQGLGWIPGKVVAITPADPVLKIPHMGWNELEFATSHPLFAGIESGAHAYFVHSYQFITENPLHCLATVTYGGSITAAIGRDNLAGTQFHPEKSQTLGLRFIGNFLTWTP
ncbi:MAG: imidazole glycerol phosphate synthase subunit HisH [Alphaproteobacteria bacterium]|nr:imidazole glycerol phosphate synthase subunit HisH [Alphaproteobacteria bacterium]